MRQQHSATLIFAPAILLLLSDLSFNADAQRLPSNILNVKETISRAPLVELSNGNNKTVSKANYPGDDYY